MCLAFERKEMRDKITGIIETYRLDGLSDEEIIAKVLRLYDVTREYMLSLLKAQAA